MRRGLWQGVSFIFLAVALAAGCKGKLGANQQPEKLSDADLQKATEEVYGLYDGYFKVIEANLADPKKVIGEGDTHLRQVEPKIKELMGKLSAVGYTEQQKPIIEGFQEKLKNRTKDVVQKAQQALKGKAQLFAQLTDQIQRLGSAIEASATHAQAQAAGVGEELVKQQKAQILMMADTIKDVPAEGREQALNNMTQSFAGDKEALKAEIKKKLGW